MRIALPFRKASFFGGVLLIALIAALPLRILFGLLDLDRLGLSARAAQGTIWSGRLKEARLGDAELGDVDTRLASLPLLAGEARIAVAREGLQGTVELSRHSLGLAHVTGTVPAASFAGPLPVAAIDLTDVSVRFRDNVCDQADGLTRVTLAATPNLPQSLAGALRCDAGALLVPLRSASGTQGLNLRIRSDGHYTAELQGR